MTRALALSVVMLGALAGVARAEDPVEAALAAADRRYADLDYRGAADLAERAVADARAKPEQQARGWERVGLSWLVLNQKGLAKEAFDRLFTMAPGREIADPSLSPRQLQFIDEIRKKHPVPPKPEPVPEPVPTTTLEPAPSPPVPAPAPARKPVYKRWYLWTPIALVLVGAGVGVGLALGLPKSGPSGTLPPGSVGLALHF